MTGASRRRYLACLGTTLIGLAGCAGDDTDPAGMPNGETAADADDDRTEVQEAATADEQEATETATPDDGAEGDDEAATETSPLSDELDLREANVVDVDVSEEGDERYRFDVALHHDDDGEDGYANWWQVETLDGEQLGRRELTHAHSQQPFTRSETMEVPDDVDCVVVRGHDQTHEYGGQVMLVTIESGATEVVQQGEEPESFENATCPS